MSGLQDILVRRIAATGPITVADFMSECLLHPEHGYYSTNDPLGAAGDFTTAPEISQMFGELIGLSLAQSWIDQGRPDPFVLAELGPGRGTLMADVLRATLAVPGFHRAARLWLIEASPVLRERQRQLLEIYAPHWGDQADELPHAPLFLIANEFFDALPIRQFQRATEGWCERQIGLNGESLGFGLTPPAPVPMLDHRLQDTKAGDLVEICPQAKPVIEAIAGRIADHGGVALVVDYGDWRSLGDTLQALKAHQVIDPLAEPGECDLTAHVDFEALAFAATGVQHSNLTPQGVFLERLGITQRAQKLAQKLGGSALEDHIAAHRRLTHPQEMGTLFKVLGLFPTGMSPPPGLDP